MACSVGEIARIKGFEVRAIRKGLKMSRREFGKMFNYSYAAIHAIETGRRVVTARFAVLLKRYEPGDAK